ncbi:phosphate ABC transporter permease PstA [Temperatibacter marinus]|uniref:Phosphate transport system permease protein PstA n=1 Tax=Temperatibacter marinus TaxID=1456591 RepID=A0AA52HBB7_9PROT|nr:phosphate ABC transporter permease PstA [Temperatibacter marinus]WND03473.1 phosphate ABC transporter permease PstA [Temperatibacter marinus]
MNIDRDLKPTDWTDPKIVARIKSRYNKERRFKIYGFSAMAAASIFLFVLIGTIGANGISGLFQTYIKLDVTFEQSRFNNISQSASNEEITSAVQTASYRTLLRNAVYAKFPDVKNRRDKRRLAALISPGARTKLKEYVQDNPSVIGTTQTLWLLASDDIDQLQKGAIDAAKPESDRRVKDIELTWVAQLEKEKAIQIQFHKDFFTNGDSRDPENVGILGAVMGTIFTLTVTLLLAFPVGLFAAIYLEEFAPQNKFTDFIEININNLAAVPSIVFGLLGLAVFLGTFNLPRSAPLVGGLTLALMTLPTIIISSRAAIKAVPPSIRDAAFGLGASRAQVVFHHVVPLAMPGILTGTIIGMAQALGETAPLLMIGMVAFIVDIPGSAMDAATALPVQVFIWANSPERLFIEKTSAAILILLLFLISMNAVAIWLRNKFEKQW